jgi:transcriptional regulator with XRE-family HTH domain
MGSTPAPEQEELDGWIGSRIRDRRRMLGLAQHELAEALGISHQQLQKYEAGKNRISASRLWWCADVLDTPIDYFFFDRPGRQAADGSTTRNQVRP